VEDGQEFSLAGMCESFLFVPATLEDITRNIVNCWMSLWQPRVVSYIRQHISFRNDASSDSDSLPQLPQMAVVVQLMIDSQRAGVLFTTHPTLGLDSTMLTEAVFGQGEALVSGEITPASYSLDWRQLLYPIRGALYAEEFQSAGGGGAGGVSLTFSTETPLTATAAPFNPALVRNNPGKVQTLKMVPPGRSKGLEGSGKAAEEAAESAAGLEQVATSAEEQTSEPIEEEQAVQLAAMGVRVASFYGYPQDIEWAFDPQGRLFLTQTRPITKILAKGVSL
jgi:phosphoenolpyruvate synthase/pyruvate phosphate dikinase